MKPRKRLKWLVVIIVWLAVIVMLLELGLRVSVAALPPRLRAAVQIVIQGSRYPEPWEKAWTPDPDYYYILKPGLVDALQFANPNVSFRVSTIELWDGARLGFRNRPVDYFVHIVVLGDSFAFCFTERADCWVTRLERDTGLGIVNLGIPGAGSQSRLQTLRNFGAPMKPPLVVWQFFGNDFNDDYGHLHGRDKIRPLQDDASGKSGATQLWLRSHSALYLALESVIAGGSAWRGPGGAAFDEPFSTRLPSGEWLRFGQPYEIGALDMSRAVNQAGLEISRAVFESAKDLVTSWGGQLVVALVPTREEVYQSLTAAALGDDLAVLSSASLAMLDLCAELQLICFDPLAEMRAAADHSELLYYADDLHLNPAGNRVYADLLRQWLAENGFLAR